MLHARPLYCPSFIHSSGRTCVAGQSCAFKSIYGKHMSTDDRLAILDTCGVAVVGAAADITDATVANSGTVGVQVGFQPQTASASWGSAVLTASGGQYRLCWCAGGMLCKTSDDFRVDILEVTVVGPAVRGTYRTCVSGQSCRLDGVVGLHLSDRDLVHPNPATHHKRA